MWRVSTWIWPTLGVCSAGPDDTIETDEGVKWWFSLFSLLVSDDWTSADFLSFLRKEKRSVNRFEWKDKELTSFSKMKTWCQSKRNTSVANQYHNWSASSRFSSRFFLFFSLSPSPINTRRQRAKGGEEEKNRKKEAPTLNSNCRRISLFSHSVIEGEEEKET